MRGTRSIHASRALRALALTAMAAGSALGAAATADAATSPPTISRVSTTMVDICVTGDRPQPVSRVVVYNGATKLSEANTDCQTVTGLAPAQTYTLTVKSGPVGSTDAELVEEGQLEVRTRAGGPGYATTVNATTATICIGGLTRAPTYYTFMVFDGDAKLAEANGAGGPQAGPCVPVSGLQPDTRYKLTITSAIAPSTGTGAFEEYIFFRTLAEQTELVPPVLGAVTDTTATICLGGDRPPVVRRVVFFSGQQKLLDELSDCPTVTGLTPDTGYAITVKTGAPGDEDIDLHDEGRVTFKTAPAIVPPTIGYTYALSGAATLKTLTKGSVPLKGGIAAKLDTASGAFTGDLTLDKTSGNLVALGFLPVSAQIVIVPTEQVTGTLTSGALNATAKLRIKLPKVSLFGVQIGGGASCQAKQISSVTLKSTQTTFDPAAGGPIAGTFSISDLAGCGALNGIISPLTAGKGNALLLNLTPTA